jgi:hypothetical protein
MSSGENVRNTKDTNCPSEFLMKSIFIAEGHMSKIIFHISCKVKAKYLSDVSSNADRLCGLVVTVPGYRSRGPGFDSRHYQIF